MMVRRRRSTLERLLRGTGKYCEGCAVTGTGPCKLSNQRSNDGRSTGSDAGRHKPLRVNSVTAHGNERTKPSVLERELRDLTHVRTLDELTNVLLKATSRLRTLDVFRSIDMVVDSANRPNTCDVHVNVQERDILSFNTGTYMQGSEMSAEGKVVLRNPLGRAEQIHVDASAGTQKSTTFSLACVVKPSRNCSSWIS